MRPTFKIQSLVLLLAAFLLLHACAKQGYPSGGPKDETPPVVLGTTPANGTLNFDAKEFSIAFDEYVQVKDVDNNILVSPPMKQKPEYGTKGRSVVVKIKDTLRENTTYLFQFKGGIVDFNEGNPLASFEYVFSTGSAIDSMTIRGQVLDAFTGKPSKETVTVAAYLPSAPDTLVPAPDTLPNLSDLSPLSSLSPSADSVVAKEHPLYITRCDPEGNFQLNHMRPGRYLLIAFLDGDKNLRLGNDEAVAFLDTLVASQKMPPAPDTAAKDTTALDSAALDSTALDSAALDTTSLDTTTIQAIPTVKPVTLYLSLFKQEQQRVTKSDFKKKGLIEISTLLPLSDTLALYPLDANPSDTTLYIKYNRSRDTLTVWPAKKDCDSLTLVIADHQLSDTLRLQYRSKAPGKSPLAKLTPPSMKSLAGGSHPYYDTLWIAFETPVLTLAVPDSATDSAVTVFCLTDSTTAHCAIRLHPDLYPTGSSRARLDFAGKQGSKYKFTVPQGLFKDIYGQVNADSLSFTTEYTKAESYGNIILTLTRKSAPTSDTLPATADTLAVLADSASAVQDSVTAVDTPLGPLLIQLTNEKGDLLRQFVVTHDQKLTFPYLKGGKYNLRAVLDSDGDGKWTPGDYWKQRQPEPVIYFNKTLELRENWDMEEKWEIAL